MSAFWPNPAINERAKAVMTDTGYAALARSCLQHHSSSLLVAL
jgi:hypothetical protein